MTQPPGYTQALDAYLVQLREVFSTPPGTVAPTAAVRSGGGVVPIDVLADRAEKLVAASRNLGDLTTPLLEADNQELREAAEMKLLAQANAEVEVALALLEAAGDEEDGETQGVTRGSSTAGGQAMARLLGVLEAPIEDGITPLVDKQAMRGIKSTDIAAARLALRDQVDFSLEIIIQQAARSGSKALDTLLSMDTSLLQQGVALISNDAAELLEKISAGLNALLKRLAKSAMQLLLQAYDWVLALIGKDVEQAARKKVKEWIDELRSSHTAESGADSLAGSLVKRIFNPGAVTDGLEDRLERCKAELKTLNDTVDAIEKIAVHYEAKAKRAEAFFKLTGAVKLLPLPVEKLPFVQVGVAAVTLGLMGYVLYSGYDHVDSGSVTFFKNHQVQIPDRVTGIRATLEQALI